MTHSAPGTAQLPGPCWPAPDLPCDPCFEEGNPAHLDEFTAAYQAAADFVWQQTCERWPGDCWIETTRPCLPECGCSCPTQCYGCGIWREFDLTDAFQLPVVEILRVEIGACGSEPEQIWTPETGEFRLEFEGTLPRLVRQIGVDEDRLGWWPVQQLQQRAGQPCTWQVVARTGVAPPASVVTATSALAMSIVKECRQTGCSVLQGARRVGYRDVQVEYGDDDLGDDGVLMEMLRKIFDRWGDCGEGSHSAFGWVPSGDAPRFHRVQGPSS